MVQLSIKSRTIEVQITRHHASLDAMHEDLVAPILCTVEHLLVINADGGCQPQQQIECHFSVLEGKIVFAAGLVPLLSQKLEQQGYDIQVMDRTFYSHLHHADETILDDPELTPEEHKSLAKLNCTPRGQILLDHPSQTGRRIALLARLFHDRNILVVVRNTHEKKRIAAEIARHTDRPVTTNPKEAWSHHPRLLVLTLKLSENVGGDDFDILLYADTQSALSNSTQTLPLRFRDAISYAFRAVQPTLHPTEEFKLQQVFGPVIYQRENPNPHPDVTVLFAEVADDEVPQSTDTGLARKRDQYWHNQCWNNAIIRVTQSAVAQGLPEGRSAPSSEVSSVAIIVESTEHGRELMTRLHGWELRTMNDYTSCVPAVQHREIATFRYATTHHISADIVIRADGGPDWPLGDALVSNIRATQDRVTLIDFRDQRDKQSRQETESRRAAYQQVGWEIVEPEGQHLGSEKIDSTNSSSGHDVKARTAMNQLLSMKTSMSNSYGAEQ